MGFRTWGISAVAVFVLSACSSGSSGTDPEPQAPTETTVTVSPPTANLEEGGATVSLTADVRDQNGSTMQGTSVTWASNNSSVASVNTATGQVTSGQPGVAEITATTGTASGSAQVTVTGHPVASVEVSGPSRAKVGHPHSYSAVARLSDGTEVSRPMTWSVSGTGAGTISADGVLEASGLGSLQVQVAVDGQTWDGPSVVVYDWLELVSDTHMFLGLESHIPADNRFGVSGFPELVIGCNIDTSFFTVWIGTPHVVSASGQVSYSIDGDISSGTWNESSDFRNLFHPGSSDQRKAFASQLAASDLLIFIFTEFNSGHITGIFHLAGLEARLPALLNACPVNYLAPPAAPSAEEASAATSELERALKVLREGR